MFTADPREFDAPVSRLEPVPQPVPVPDQIDVVESVSGCETQGNRARAYSQSLKDHSRVERFGHGHGLGHDIRPILEALIYRLERPTNSGLRLRRRYLS
jgi:hypothetical protein